MHGNVRLKLEQHTRPIHLPQTKTQRLARGVVHHAQRAGQPCVCPRRPPIPRRTLSGRVHAHYSGGEQGGGGRQDLPHAELLGLNHRHRSRVRNGGVGERARAAVGECGGRTAPCYHYAAAIPGLVCVLQRAGGRARSKNAQHSAGTICTSWKLVHPPCAENVSSCGPTTQLGTPNAPVLVKETHHRTPQRTRNGKRAVPCPVPGLRCGVCKVVTFVARRITAAAIIESSKPLFSDLAWRRRSAPFVPILLVA